MLHDLHHALRRLVRAPGFTVTALTTLALCLGANLTIFAVVDAILVRALPFPAPEQLVAVINSYPGAGYERGGPSVPNYFDRCETIKAFASVSLFAEQSQVVGGSGAPERVPAARVTPEFFATLGVPFVQGRAFTDAELTYATDQVAILTDGFWRSHFNAASDVIGRTFLNDGVSVTVIGVLPPDFHFSLSPAQFFRPLSHAPEGRSPQHRHNSAGQMIARLALGATLAQAQAQLDALDARQAGDDPMAAFLKEWRYRTLVRPLHEDHVREVKPMLLLLQGGALLLLFIGLVNLVNLLLIRASSRGKELAVRRALGASRRHLARDVALETWLLSLGGGALGVLLGAFGIAWLSHLGIDRLPLGAMVRLDGRTAATGFAAALLVGPLIAAPVIWFNLRTQLASGLQIETRGGTSGRAAQQLRSGFIVVQIALAFILLSSAGLLGLSLKRLLATPPGFAPAHVLTGEIALPWKRYPNDVSQLQFVERLLPAIRALPGVTHAAINNGLPFSGLIAGGPVTIEGLQSAPGETIRAHRRSGVTSDYWAAMEIPLRRGRLLADSDNGRPETVCVIDEAMAARYWPGADPLGHRLAFATEFNDRNAATIVGVVAEVKQSGLAEAGGFGAAYFPYSKFRTSFFSVVVRTTLPPAALTPTLRKTILQLDPELPIDDLSPLQTRIDHSLVARRSPAILTGIFAGVALLLAGIGTYGVLAYAVGQRQREIGIRMALGALPRQVLRHFLTFGIRLLGAGLAFGLLGAWLTGLAMQNLLYGVGSMNILILTITAVVLLLVVFLALFLPARRAARVDPLIALRAE